MNTIVQVRAARDLARENRVGTSPCRACKATAYHRRGCPLYVTWCHGYHDTLGGHACPYKVRGRGVIGASYGHDVVYAPARLPWGQRVRDAYVLCPEQLAAFQAGIWEPYGAQNGWRGW